VLVPSYKIHSTVENGWVTLEGEVEYYSERADTERAVSRLRGVRGVTNEIAVCAPTVESERAQKAVNLVEAVQFGALFFEAANPQHLAQQCLRARVCARQAVTQFPVA
jgi:hypothetical protein